MPRVPVYDEQQVAESPISGVKYQNLPDTGMANLGRAVSGVGDILDKRAQEMQEEDDAAQLTEVYAAASDKVRQVMRGEGGVLNRTGKDAFGGYEDTDKTLAEIAREAEANLRTSDQRTDFRRLWLQQRSSNLNAVARHIAQERKAYRQNVAEVGAKAALEDIAAAYDNPEVVSQHLATGKALIRANLAGQAPEVIAEKEAAYESNARAVVVERMAQTDPMAAKDYYRQHKDSIDGITQAKLEKTLESESLRAESQAAADRIVGTGGTLESQLQEARAIDDPKLRDETVRRVKDRYNEQKAIKEQARKDLVEDAWRLVVGGGSLDVLSVEHKEALGASGMSGLRSYVQNGGEVVTDLPTYYELQDLATNDPKAFANVPLIQYAGKIGKSDLDRLYSLQRSGAGSKDIVLGRTLKQIQDDALRSAGIKYGQSASKGNNEKAALFRRKMEEAMQAEGITKDDKDWREKAQAVADRLMIEGEIKGGLFDPDRRLFEVNDGEQFILDSVDRVPESEQAKISEALRRANQPVTDEAIIRLYKLKNGIQ